MKQTLITLALIGWIVLAGWLTAPSDAEIDACAKERAREWCIITMTK